MDIFRGLKLVPRRISMRTILLLSSAGLITVALVIIVVVVSVQMRSTLTVNTGKDFVSLAQFNRDRFSEQVTAEVNLLQTLSRDQSLYNYVLQDAEADLGSMSSTQLEALFAAREKAWATNTNDNLHNGILVNAASKKMQDFITSFPGHPQIFLTNKYGAVVASAGTLPSSYRYKDSAWQHPNLDTGANVFYVGDPQVGAGKQDTTIAVAVPIIIPNTGVIRGYLYARYQISELKMLNTVSNENRGQVALVNSNTGVVVFDPSASLVGTHIPSSLEATIASRKTPNWTTAIDSSGKDSIYGYAPLTLNPSQAIDPLQWEILVHQPKSVALSVLNQLVRTFVIVSLITLLGAVALGIWFTTLLTRPILQLTKTANALSSGDFTVKAHGGGPRELELLAAAFNDMATKLKSFYVGLEEKVFERTKVLERTQVELRTSAQRDEALLASIGDGIIATDRNGITVLVNKAAEDMLHFTRKDAIGRRYSELWNLETEEGEALSDADRPIDTALRTGKAIKDSDHYCVRRDAGGKEIVRFPVAISVSPVLLNGQTFGTINVFSDITHEKQVDRMKTEFISLASHQLRTPLSAIRWFNEMLLSGDAGELTEDQKELAQNAYDSTARMIELVNSLLNTSRIESGRIIVDPQPTDLKELIQTVVNDLKGKTEAKKQTLIVDVHADLPKINLDARLISQVYLNFLTNAIKYSPPGAEISVFVSHKGDELVSQISDNGYGIPKAQQGRVFQKFFRAENAVKVETDGTGLGLYLVKAIIESSGGRVWFESEENKGTSFWFSLPMSGMKSKAGEVTLDS